MNKFEEMNNKKLEKVNLPTFIVAYLKELGFKKGLPTYIKHDDTLGMVQSYLSENKAYRTIVHISHEGVRYYKEYECGGHVGDGHIELADGALNDLNSFVDYMGDTFERISFG